MVTGDTSTTGTIFYYYYCSTSETTNKIIIINHLKITIIIIINSLYNNNEVHRNRPCVVTWLPSALAAGPGNSNGSVRPPVINPYKKAPAAAPTAAAGVATRQSGGRNNTSTKPAPKRQKINEFDGRSDSTKGTHKGAVKKWDHFALINGYSTFYRLTRQQVCGNAYANGSICGNVYANGSMANPENPPLKKCLPSSHSTSLNTKRMAKKMMMRRKEY